MIKKELPNGDVLVQAWRCTKDGVPSLTVYTQEIAIDKMAEGYDFYIITIVRHADGNRSYLPGVIVNA